ncbi:hypothetical protein Poly30_00400 [Planctomycetes bacterium Poly30]|uniref:Right handed beta helix domain-containing protein n=1 Tax=Saltatorellus ferox TaxID=2528018 RepID=A0A518EKC9_9BACT|nr:hypothetical protein Poly30_00400 [Planctomycetes bacterium Poly30]
MLSLLALAILPQTTWFVDSSALPPGDGTLAAPYTRIDHAVAQPGTLDGDTLRVLAGVYSDERIQLGAKGLNLLGDGAPGAIVLTGSSAGSILTADATTSPMKLTNLTFRGGRGEFSAAHGGTAGGAIRAMEASLTLEDCLFEDCTADFGGAIAADASGGDPPRMILRDTEFREDCVAAIDGGAIHHRNGVLQVFDSVVHGHALGGRGGAIFFESEPPISNPFMNLQRSVIEGTAYGDGGAIFTSRSNPNIVDCTVEGRCLGNGRGGCLYTGSVHFPGYRDSTFRGGRAVWGGAIYGAGLRIYGCTFEDNATWSPLGPELGGGGAVYALGVALIEESIFRGNRATHHPRASGGAFFGSGSVDRCTFVDNDATFAGAAMFCYEPGTGLPHLRRSIVLRAQGSTTPPFNAGTIARNNIIEGGYAAYPNNLDADPLFWGASDFHLLPGSPAIATSPGGMDKGAFPFDPSWCGEGCDGPIGLVSCTAMPGSLGVPAEISAIGSTDVAVDRVVLTLAQIPTFAPALLLASQSPDFVPNAGGSSGSLCLGGQILRFPVEGLFYGGQTIVYRPVLSEFPMGTAVQAGQSWFFQFWFRETNSSGPTSNFSPALYVPFQ